MKGEGFSPSQTVLVGRFWTIGVEGLWGGKVEICRGELGLAGAGAVLVASLKPGFFGGLVGLRVCCC